MNRRLSEQRLRGAIDLVRDAVTGGSDAILRTHLAIADRPFALVAQVPGIEAPTRAIQAVHDASVTFSYTMVRLVTEAVATSAHTVLDVVAK